MKKIVFCFLGLLAVLYTASAQSYTFNHGPYLQELSEHAVTFVFTTSDKGFSWVEVKPDGGEAERHYTVRNGLRDAYNTFNVIRVENLRPDTRYQYRLCSKQIADFQPYKVTFGDSIVSPWRRFSTPDPKATACSFIALSDMHQQPDKLGRLLNQAGVGSADMIFYVGDMMNYYDNEETPFRSFIDKSVELFASEKPFVLVRGNHETRGNMAREYARYVPKSSGKYYGAYRVGDIMFIVFDCGEDKPDDFWVRRTDTLESVQKREMAHRDEPFPAAFAHGERQSRAPRDTGHHGQIPTAVQPSEDRPDDFRAHPRLRIHVAGQVRPTDFPGNRQQHRKRRTDRYRRTHAES